MQMELFVPRYRNTFEDMSIDPLDLPQDKNLKDDHVLPLIEPLDKISNDVNILNSLNAFSLPREKVAKADNILIYVDPLTVPRDEVSNNSIGTNFDDDHMPQDRDCSTYLSNPKTRACPQLLKLHLWVLWFLLVQRKL